MQTNLALHAPLFAGAVTMNGVPVINEGSTRFIETKGGIVSLNNIATAIAYFGCVMSVNLAGDDDAFYVGNPAGAFTVMGVLLNEQGVRENDPAKPTYIMNEMPCTVVTRGRLWYMQWDTNFAGAIALPTVGCRIVFRWVYLAAASYAGELGFGAAAMAVPGTHSQVQAAVINYNVALGADIDFFIPVTA